MHRAIFLALALAAPLVHAEPGPLRIGTPREVAALAPRWTAIGDGRAVGRIDASSPGARALRLGLRARALPANATLRFADGAGRLVAAVPASHVTQSLARDAGAGAGTGAALFWSSVIEGDTATVELELAREADIADVDIAVPRLSHLVATGNDDFAAAKSGSSACQTDFACSGALDTQSRATARMVFTLDGTTWACTGVLVNDSNPRSFTPYLLTANHCMPTQAAASSLQTTWLYRAASCGMGDPSPAPVTLTRGAIRHYGDPATDTALLELLELPPPGTRYAGWTTAGDPLGAEVTGLHHAAGDAQKVSRADVTGHEWCASPGSGLACTPSTFAQGNFYRVGFKPWTSANGTHWGVVETGSSGSGLFLADGTLIGQLRAGAVSCAAPSGPAWYGRFDVAYRGGLSALLGPASLAVAADPWADADSDQVPGILERGEGLDPTVKDNDIFTRPRLFAMQQYRDFLGREGDASGIAFYVNLLNGGSADRIAIIESFLGSPEFRDGLPSVTRLYLSFFGRIPDAAGLAFQLDALRSGMPLEVIAQNFALSPEFTRTYGALTHEAYINLVYRNVLGRAPDAAGYDYYFTRLEGGVLTRGQVMTGFSESQESRDLTRNESFVIGVYLGLLGRAPEPSGVDFHVNLLEGGATTRDMISGFFNSPEYRTRFLP